MDEFRNHTFAEIEIGTTAAFAHRLTRMDIDALALVSGDPQGVACDCNPTGDACDSASCNLVFGSCGCGGQRAEHLGREQQKAWRASR